MTDKLQQICDTKRLEVAARKQRASLAHLESLAKVQSAPRGFRAALQAKAATGFAAAEAIPTAAGATCAAMTGRSVFNCMRRDAKPGVRYPSFR